MSTTKNKPWFKKWWIWLLAFIVLGGIIGTGSKEDKSNKKEVVSKNVEINTNKGRKEKKEKEPEKISWNEQIKEIATSEKSKTEKFDAVMAINSTYKPTETEISLFIEDITSEFKNNTYLSNIENDEYMLTNAFKSRAINKFYDDSLQKPMDKFAFDFWQNTKYVYRGVDAVDSEAVLLNEEQMRKSLNK